MQVSGIEPPRAEARGILSPLRLPVPPHLHCASILGYLARHGNPWTNNTEKIPLELDELKIRKRRAIETIIEGKEPATSGYRVSSDQEIGEDAARASTAMSSPAHGILSKRISSHTPYGFIQSPIDFNRCIA